MSVNFNPYNKVERNRNDDIKLISEIVKREIKAENIYTFSFTLCDNDIDRDNECFSIETLIEFKKMFIGKTGIFDNEIKPVLQYPRVYKCELESVSHKETKQGLPYMKLTAYAFVEKIGDIRELMRIAEDDEKEVSVACSIMKRECSICGKNTISNGCDHVKGRIYNKKRCYYTLREPKDVYEWAIVAKSEGK